MLEETPVMASYRKKIIKFLRLSGKARNKERREVLKWKAHTLLLLYLEEARGSVK